MPKRVLLSLVFLAVASCGPAGEGPVDLTPPKVDLVWPAPPAAARIRYLYSFDKPSDLGARPSVLEGLWRLFAGGERRGMVRPYALAVDGPMLVVADPGAGAVHVFNRERRSYKRIEKANKSHLLSPVGAALGSDRIFVSDSALGKVFVFDFDGKLLAEMAPFERPTGLAIDRQSGCLFVADTLAHQIAVFDLAGNALFRFGGRGKEPGQFNYPTHLALADGRLIVNDNMNFRIQTFELDGTPLAVFGEHGASSGYLSQPKGVGVDTGGHVYVAESMVNRVQIFDQEGRFLLALGGTGSGPGQFMLPAGIAVSDDKIYVADSYNRRVQVFEFLGGDGS